MTKPSDERIELIARAIYQWWMDDMPPTGRPETTYDEWGDKDYFRRCAKSALIADDSHLAKENERMREALEFIAEGCLVPPDGGSPCFEDAVRAARQALNDMHQGGTT